MLVVYRQVRSGWRDATEAELYAPGWPGAEWMETGDLVGCFRQLVHFQLFRLGLRSNRVVLGRQWRRWVLHRWAGGWLVRRSW